MKETKKKYISNTWYLDSTADARFNNYIATHPDYQIKFITAAGGDERARIFVIFEVEDTDE